MTKFKCEHCEKVFASIEARHQHHRDKHRAILPYPQKKSKLNRYDDDDDSEAWRAIRHRYGF